jgi:hypothetical protein
VHAISNPTESPTRSGTGSDIGRYSRHPRLQAALFQHLIPIAISSAISIAISIAISTPTPLTLAITHGVRDLWQLSPNTRYNIIIRRATITPMRKNLLKLQVISIDISIDDYRFGSFFVYSFQQFLWPVTRPFFAARQSNIAGISPEEMARFNYADTFSRHLYRHSYRYLHHEFYRHRYRYPRRRQSPVGPRGTNAST